MGMVLFDIDHFKKIENTKGLSQKSLKMTKG